MNNIFSSAQDPPPHQTQHPNQARNDENRFGSDEAASDQLGIRLIIKTCRLNMDSWHFRHIRPGQALLKFPT